MPTQSPRSRKPDEAELIDCIYEASLDGRAFARVADRLSEAFGGAGIVISMGLPGSAPPQRFYRARLDPSFEETISARVAIEIPWDRVARPQFLNRFLDGGEFLSAEQFAELDYYRECLKPHGIAPLPPLGLLVGFEDSTAVAGLGIWRMEPDPPFGPEDVALGTRLAPHFVRAVAVHHRLVSYRQRRDALAAVIDRLPIGVAMLDERGHVVATNSAADRIVAQRGGLHIENGVPRAEDDQEDVALRRLIENAVVREAEPGETHGSVMSISRAGDGQALSLMVAPLLPTEVAGAARDPVAALFVTDSEEGPISAADALCALYGFTASEAELTRLLAGGCSLEEAATQRRITINTARGHLKRAFQKTGRRRQSDLVRLVLTSVARLRSA